MDTPDLASESRDRREPHNRKSGAKGDGDAPLISLRGITKIYKVPGESDHVVLKAIDLDIKPGSFTVIRGESGSGKTTLLRILGMLDRDFQGDFTFGGIDVMRLDGWETDELRAENIGFIFQDGRMFDHLSVRENISVGLRVRDGNMPVEEVNRRVEELAGEFLNKEAEQGLLQKVPTRISGGQKQRAAIMRAFINRPALILADEPTASLDPERKVGVLEILKRLNDAGNTVVVVSHDAVFQDIGRQILLKYGVMSEESAGPVVTGQPPQIKLPPPASETWFGWRPRATFPILVRQVWRDIVMRPTFALMIAAALAAGATQVGVLSSVLTGANDYIDFAVTHGSRLNRIQIKPLLADLDKAEHFPIAEEIKTWPGVAAVVPRRTTLTKLPKANGENNTYPAMGLQDDDPEYKLLDFVAGGPFTAGNSELEVILTAGLIPDLFADAGKLADGSLTYDSYIGRKITVLIPTFTSTGDILRETPVLLTIKGIILAGEGGRQLYMPNATSLAFDRMKMDRTGEMQLPLNDAHDAWTDRAKLAEMQNFAWEDQLHIYSKSMRDIIPVFKKLNERRYKPQSDIWDYKWVLDIQSIAQLISLPLLVLIIAAVALTVWSNITASAKLQERELALWRILGMRRGDLVAMQVMATAITIAIGAVVGIAIAWITVDVARSFLANEAAGTEVVFSPVSHFAVPIVVAAIIFGVIVAIWPAQRTARAELAKVLQ